MGLGDNSAFSRKIFSLVFSGKVESPDLYWGTEVRTGHTKKFVRAFERLLDHANRCDPDGIISDALRDGSHGRVYHQMISSRDAG